jgi:RNA polymerase sigma factor (sigma-70 family)
MVGHDHGLSVTFEVQIQRTVEVKKVPKEDLELFEALKAGRHERLDEVYTRYRSAFLVFARRDLYATEEDAADCFQESVIALYKNIVSGRMPELSSRLGTYLFGIGKRYVYRKNKQRFREVATDPDAGIGIGNQAGEDLDLSIFHRIEDEHQKAMLAAGFARLGDTCREILTLFYYHNYPIESIQDSLNLSSPGATRIKKMRCLDKLKQILIPPSK